MYKSKNLFLKVNVTFLVNLTSFLMLTTLFFTPKVVRAADTLPPTTTITKSPNTPDGNNGWYVNPISITLRPNDLDSGVKELNYRINNGVWQKVEFANTLNLIQNPSFETGDSGSSTLIQKWEKANDLPNAIYSQDTGTFYSSAPSSSAKIISTGETGNWYGINNQNQFVPAVPFDNMSAYVWVKSENITQTAYYKVYIIKKDSNNAISYSEIERSTTISGTNDWTKLGSTFIVADAEAIGVYLEVGLEGPGTLWIDNVYLSSATLQPEATVVLGTDTKTGQFEYYSVDNVGNTEIYSCTNPITNCFTYKLDQTPPGNWNNSGAFRGVFGANYELYVYTNVEDAISGISTFTDKYQYQTELNPTFGKYSNLLSCNSTWQANQDTLLISPPFLPGVASAYLLTPKTSFCNNNWRICKIVRFKSEDMAGNKSEKDLCINGPWIRVSNEGIVRSNNRIDMLSEADDDNTDGLIEASGNGIDFFTSSKNWEIKNLQTAEFNTYDDYYEMTTSKQTVSGLNASNGVFVINGDLTIDNNVTPAGYTNNPIEQIVFVNGTLTINETIHLNSQSAIMFIVKENIRISKNVNSVEAALSADGEFETAYDLTEGEAGNTLNLYGTFAADTFNFQRTLQGTNNSNIPSEDFYFEPKYLVQLKRFFTGGYEVEWR